MKYFYVQTITMYDGLEFIDKSITQNKNEEAVRKEFSEQGYITHDDTEIIDRMDIREITKAEFDFLQKFI